MHFVSSGLNATEKEVSVGGEGAIYLLENTRFHAFETKPIKKEEEEANSFACQFQVDVRLLRILQNIYMTTCPTYSVPNSFFFLYVMCSMRRGLTCWLVQLAECGSDSRNLITAQPVLK